jgi:Flp pilus assembly protein TadD
VSARFAGLALVLGVVALAGCGGSGAPAPPAADASKLRAQALVDSGNSAFRGGDFTSAAKRYAAAAVVNPEDPAAFYGLGMALAKLGRDDEARVAYARSRELSRGEVDHDAMPHEVRYRRTTHP